MSPLHIVFLDRASLPVPLRTPGFAHTLTEYDGTAPEEVVARAQDADIVITNKVALPAEIIADLPRLKLIAVAATGVNIIDIAAAKARDITVCNIRGYADYSVPEHALMLMLALSRNLRAYQDDLAKGAWQSSPYFCLFGAPVRDLYGKTLTLFGQGSLGRRTATLAAAFGMQVQYAEHKGAANVRDGYVRFEDAIAGADILSLHCPLTADTQGLIGAAELALMKPDALLINTARGGLVDEAALLAALQAGRLGGAALDVLATEPPRQGSPLLDSRLSNLIITPHVGWASFEAMSRLAEQLIENCEAYAAGAPQNIF